MGGGKWAMKTGTVQLYTSLGAVPRPLALDIVRQWGIVTPEGIGSDDYRCCASVPLRLPLAWTLGTVPVLPRLVRVTSRFPPPFSFPPHSLSANC